MDQQTMIYIALAVIVTYLIVKQPGKGGYHMEKKEGYVCSMCRGG
jgi:hypothetical protein